MAQVCFKCKVGTGTFLSRNGVSKLYCSDCFSDFCVKTFKNSLFGHCGLSSNEPIAVAVSGGINSMFLLYQLGVLRVMGTIRGGEGRTEFIFLPFHLCEEELVLASTSPVAFSAGTNISGDMPLEEGLFSTFSSTRGAGDSSPKRFSPSAKRQATFFEHLRVQFQLLPLSILKQMEKWEWASQPLFPQQRNEPPLKVFNYSDFFSEDQMEFLCTVLHHRNISHDCREELYYRVRESVLRAAAHRLSCDWKKKKETLPDSHDMASGILSFNRVSQWVHYISGENAVRCCVNALNSVVTGGGGCSLLQQAGFCSFFHHVRQMRPLRMLLPNEVVLFCRLHHLEGLYTPTLSTGMSVSSVRRVLEGFTYELMSVHRTILFNVLTVVSHLDAERLFPLSSRSLDSEKGVDAHKKKHMVFSKVMSRHEYLSKNDPPQLPFRGGAGSVADEEKMCFMCGCPIHSGAAANVSEGKQSSAVVGEQEHEEDQYGDSREAGKRTDLVCCIPCRECINSTFYSKRNIAPLSSWIEICKSILQK